jgi:hypothetical protein
MSITDKKRAANRRNAQKSTGPRSAEGKAIVRWNGLKHGLRSRQRIIPGENIEEYEAIHDALRKSVNPADHLEEALVAQMTDAEWRRRRFNRWEADIFWRPSNVMPPEEDDTPVTCPDGRVLQDPSGPVDHLASLVQFEAAARRSFYEALETLEARRRLIEPEWLHDEKQKFTTKPTAGLNPIDSEACPG